MRIKELLIGKTKLPLPGWVALFVLGGALQGFARFLSIPGNPTGFSWDRAPIVPSIAAVFLALYGYFYFAKGQAQNDDVRKRTGLWMIILGLFMLAIYVILEVLIMGRLAINF